jgi:hypothetical protein
MRTQDPQVVKMRVRDSGDGARGGPDDIEIAAADLAAFRADEDRPPRPGSA